jgi:hypothetical protein
VASVAGMEMANEDAHSPPPPPLLLPPGALSMAQSPTEGAFVTSSPHDVITS